MEGQGGASQSALSALTPYHQSARTMGDQGGALIVINAETQAVIRNQLHNFLAATQRELLSLSHAQNMNHEQTQQQLQIALDQILARVNADAQQSVMLSHDDLYRQLAARVDAGIEHIGTIRQNVEERAITVAETRVNNLVENSRRDLSSQLDRLLNERLEADIQRAIEASRQTITDNAIQVAETRASLLTHDATVRLSEELNEKWSEALQTRAQKAITDAQSAVEERALTVAENRVVKVLEETEKGIQARLDRLIAQRLVSGIEGAIVAVKKTTDDRINEVAEALLKSVTQDTKGDLETFIVQRVDETLRVRQEDRARITFSDVQQEIEDRALVSMQEGVLSNIREQVNGIVSELVPHAVVESLIEKSLESRLDNQIQAALDSSISIWKDSAIESVKKYEEAGKMIAERRCDEVIGRLENRIADALEQARTRALSEAAVIARGEADAHAKKSEESLVQLHEKLLRELHIQVEASSPPQPTSRETSECVSSRNHSTPTISDHNKCTDRDKVEAGGLNESRVQELEIQLGELQIRVRMGPSSGNPQRINAMTGPPSRLSSNLENAKARAMNKWELLLKEANNRVSGEHDAQNALREMQARQRKAHQDTENLHEEGLTDAERRRLEEIAREFED